MPAAIRLSAVNSSYTFDAEPLSPEATPSAWPRWDADVVEAGGRSTGPAAPRFEPEPAPSFGAPGSASLEREIQLARQEEEDIRGEHRRRAGDPKGDPEALRRAERAAHEAFLRRFQLEQALLDMQRGSTERLERFRDLSREQGRDELATRIDDIIVENHSGVASRDFRDNAAAPLSDRDIAAHLDAGGTYSFRFNGADYTLAKQGDDYLCRDATGATVDPSPGTDPVWGVQIRNDATIPGYVEIGGLTGLRADQRLYLGGEPFSMRVGPPDWESRRADFERLCLPLANAAASRDVTVPQPDAVA
jgi:hypothetical protein